MSRKAPYERIAITLPPDTLRAADELAAKHDRSRSWIIAEAVRQFAASQGIAPAGDGSKQLGASRLAQLRRDVSLSAESRVLEAEEVATVPDDSFSPAVPIRFSTYDAFDEWRRQRNSH